MNFKCFGAQIYPIKNYHDFQPMISLRPVRDPNPEHSGEGRTTSVPSVRAMTALRLKTYRSTRKLDPVLDGLKHPAIP